jgi:hypothetical protein
MPLHADQASESLLSLTFMKRRLLTFAGTAGAA